MENPPEEPPAGPRAVVVTGVAGSGKSTVARLAANELGWQFLEADDLHSAASRGKMAAGVGLNEEEREPWLLRVRLEMQAALVAGRSLFVACSALKRAHRTLLAAADGEVRFVWLDVPPAVLRDRLTQRVGHFADEQLLQTQLHALEPPAGDEAIRVEGQQPVSDVVEAVLAAAMR